MKFQVWRGSDDTQTGEYNDLGTFYNRRGGARSTWSGWTRAGTNPELEPAPATPSKQPDTQEVIWRAGKDHTVTFENTPKNCIIVEKYDSVTGEALAGCTFQLRYLAGSSGTGRHCHWPEGTGKMALHVDRAGAGSYIVEEVDPADGYSIINSSETVFLADNGEQSVVTVRFDNMPDGLLLVREGVRHQSSITCKTPSLRSPTRTAPVIGDSNGIFRTDENGEIRIEGLKPGKSVIVTEVKARLLLIDTQSQTIPDQRGPHQRPHLQKSAPWQAHHPEAGQPTKRRPAWGRVPRHHGGGL